MRNKANQKKGADVIFSLGRIGEILAVLGIGDPDYSLDDFFNLTLQGGRTRRLIVAQLLRKKIEESLTQEEFIPLLEKELNIANNVAQKLAEELEKEFNNKRVISENIKKHPSDESDKEEISNGMVGENNQDTYREPVE